MKTCNSCTYLQEELKKAQTEILRLKEELKKSVRTNPLTGLLNKVALDEHIKESIVSTKRKNETTVLFFTDLDNFKQFNDTYSHEFGDLVLKAAANAYKQALRDNDIVFHISGDEFVIQADINCVKGAENIKAKLQNAIKNLDISYNGQAINLGVSVGYTNIEANKSVSELLELADKSLHEDKEKRKQQGLRFERV